MKNNNHKAPSDRKSKIRPIRFTDRQDKILQTYTALIEANCGLKVTITWVIQEMMELGRKEFEEKYINYDTTLKDAM